MDGRDGSLGRAMLRAPSMLKMITRAFDGENLFVFVYEGGRHLKKCLFFIYLMFNEKVPNWHL